VFAQLFLSSSTSNRIIVAHRQGAHETRGASGGCRDGAAVMGGTMDHNDDDGWHRWAGACWSEEARGTSGLAGWNELLGPAMASLIYYPM
jgi:hypothetical protein